MRVVGHVTADPSAVPMLLPRTLQNLHLPLMETRHWATLSLHPEWLFPHLSRMCLLLLPFWVLKKTCRCGTSGHGLAGMVVVGW